MRLAGTALTALLSAALPAQDPDVLAILEQNVQSPWKLLGPFPSPSRNGLSTEFIDESAPDFDRVHTLANGSELRWHEAGPDHPLPDKTGNDLAFLGTDDWDTVYLARTITAAADHEAVLAFGMDDSMALWINGEEVFRREANQAVSAGQYETKAALREGDNLVLMKIVNNRGGCGFAFELTDRLEAGRRWGAGRPDDGFTCFQISDVPVPEEIVMEVGGLQFLPDGSLLVCSRRGPIYHLRDPAANDEDALGLTTFAEGLHEPLGMLLDDDGSLLVAQMPELTRLRDTDGDGRADRFDTVVQEWGLSGNYHEYHFGPVRDGAGNLWGTLNIGFPSGDGAARMHRGSAYRITPAGEFEVVCYGLRSPNGLVVNDAGEVFYTDNQGEWMDVCRLAHLRPGKYYGHDVALQWANEQSDKDWETERTLPAVWFPYHLMRSTSWPVVDRTGGKFGPYTGQIIVGDQNNSLLVRVTLELVDGVYQGACYPFWSNFAGGINRLAFDSDGVLYVGLTNRGWGSVAPKSHGLQRIAYVGPTPFDILEVKATRVGFDVHFTKPLGDGCDLAPHAVRVREYGYHHWSTYGSPEIESRAVEVVSTATSADRRRVSIVTGERNTGKAFHISLRGRLVSEDGQKPITREAFYTLLAIP